MDRLIPSTSVLMVIDVQDRLASVVEEDAIQRVVQTSDRLLQCARTLKVPVCATEQNPKRLGRTVEPLKAHLDALSVTPIAKMAFDACDEPLFVSRLHALRCRSIVMVGLETHICIFQTARELVRRGYAVYVVADGVASRAENHRLLGLSLCETAGAFVAPAETIAFDWLREAGTDCFRSVAHLFK